MPSYWPVVNVEDDQPMRSGSWRPRLGLGKGRYGTRQSVVDWEGHGETVRRHRALFGSGEGDDWFRKGDGRR